MIYRVGDGDNPAYDYSSQLKSARNVESQEKFSLDRRKEQEYTAKKEEKGEDKKLHEKPGAQIKTHDGVKLELSGAGNKEAFRREMTTPADAGGQAASFTAFLKGIWTAVKDFFYRVWNDPPAEPISEDVTSEEAERYTEEYYAMKGITPERIEPETTVSESEQLIKPPAEAQQNYEAEQSARDERIRKHLRTGNLEQVISLLTDDGRRAVAKNSTLLTYYDKSGKLTQISASDRERILHGDRNVRKL